MSQTPEAQPPDTSFKVNGVTVRPVGAGKKKKKQTSSIWKHVVEFTPATRDGKNVKCMVKIPARWPHVGLVARLHLGIDATSCQAERNFSALKLIVSDLRSNTSPAKVEKTIFLRLNKHLIPGLGKVLRDLDALTEERKSNKEAAVNAKNAAAGSTDVSPISVS